MFSKLFLCIDKVAEKSLSVCTWYLVIYDVWAKLRMYPLNIGALGSGLAYKYDTSKGETQQLIFLQKKFCNIGSRSQWYKTFLSVIYAFLL